MRIISEFHDYYDCVQRHGQDQSLIYLRNPEEIVIKGYSWDKLSCYDYKMSKFVVGFCGKNYLGIDVSVAPNRELTAIRKCCYNEEQVTSFLQEHLKDRVFQKYLDGERYSNTSNKVKEYFDATYVYYRNFGSQYFGYDCPVFTVQYVGGSILVTKNGPLKPFEFFRMFDTQQTFQELSMYLGGLAVPLKEIPILDDITMRDIKGFNKFSFRKDKQGK